MKNNLLGFEAAKKLKQIKKGLPASIRFNKPSLRNVILVCRICGTAYRDRVDLRIDLGMCPDCRSTKFIDGKERTNPNLTKSKTDWWNDFVYYLIANGSGEGWIDPDQRKLQAVKVTGSKQTQKEEK